MNNNTDKTLKIFIVAGEPSGDVHSANLISEIQKYTNVELYGTGGKHLANLGQKQLYTVEQMAAIGFVGALKLVPFLLKAAKVMIAEIERIKPDVILLVDYSGFNLRFAKKLKKFDIPVVELVAPQVWIWHYSRVNTLRDYFDKVLCVLPFEEPLLRSEGVNAVYIGHPITDTLNLKYKDREEFCKKHNLSPDNMIIAIAPGSRQKEIKAIIPVAGKAALHYPQFQYIIPKADSINDEDILSILPDGINVKIISGETQDVFKYADLLWICSGTATLEAAILGTPMVILYTASEIDFIVAKLLTKLRMVGMPNIILQYAAVPELLGRHMTAENLITTTEKMLPELDMYRERLVPVAEMFKGRSPMKTAAQEVLKSAGRDI